MISAAEAREKSYNNNFFNKELQSIEEKIERACEEGSYFIVTDYTLYDKTVDILEELGYKVTIEEGDFYYPPETTISWEK